ncbi:hypothetical protein EZS27_023807 [termite gut metagenome]|uniref:Uncharacterized protein n=2 Tax=termite gut metagenome TaxID=433724 RepID=A0A5J4R0U6_9ZZZZ
MKTIPITENDRLIITKSLKKGSLEVTKISFLLEYSSKLIAFEELVENSGCMEDGASFRVSFTLTRQTKIGLLKALRTGFIDLNDFTELINDIKNHNPFLEMMKASAVED